MTNHFQQYIAGYTVANFLPYPIRCRVTKAGALEYFMSSGRPDEPAPSYSPSRAVVAHIHKEEWLMTDCSQIPSSSSTCILLQRPLSNDPRFIQCNYRYSHASKRF